MNRDFRFERDRQLPSAELRVETYLEFPTIPEWGEGRGGRLAMLEHRRLGRPAAGLATEKG